MALKYFKRRWQRVSVIVILVITTLVLILAVFVNRYWQPILEKKLRDIVLKSSDSLYRVDFSSAELHVLRGTIVINNILLQPDTAVYNQRLKQHLAPNNLVKLTVKQLTLMHIHPFLLYFRHRVEVGEIAVDQPELNASYRLNHTRDTVLKDTRTAWQRMSKTLHSIHIGTIRMGEVKLKYADYSSGKAATTEVKEMNLSAYDLLIDSATQTDKKRLLYCREMIGEVNNYSGKSPGGLYSYKVKSIKLSTSNSQLKLTGLTLQPLNEQAFFNKSQSERFTLRIDSCRLDNFDFLTYHKYRVLNGSDLTLTDGALGIFANPNKRPNDNDKIKSFPNVALHKIYADMRIDTITLKRFNIWYTEYNQKSRQTGTITFNNTSARILNVTNNKAALQKNNSCTIQLKSYFMNRGELNARFAFNLTDENHSFTYKGAVGPMNLQVLNPAIQPFAMVKVATGTLKQMTFDVHANSQKATGKVEVLYNNLKVTILKADTMMDALKKRPIASLYANLFIVKHNNPDDADTPPRSFNVNYVRTPDVAFFKFMWQTLLTGIKPCAGLDKKTQDATVAMVAQQAQNKEDRKKKKEMRIERRMLRREKREEKKLQEDAEVH